MKTGKITLFVTVTLLILSLVTPVAADMLDTDAIPPVVATSGSFDTTYKTRLDFSLSGGSLTDAEWSLSQMQAGYALFGTVMEGEAISLAITGIQSPVPDENPNATLVFNSLHMTLSFRDANGQLIGAEQRYSSGNVQESSISHQLGGSVPAGARSVTIIGGFKCRWTTSVVAEESVGITVKLKVEEGTTAMPVTTETTGVIAPATEPESNPDPVQTHTFGTGPDAATDPGEGDPSDEDPADPWSYNPWVHASPLVTLAIALISVLAAIFGGAIGSAGAAGAVGGAAGAASATVDPEGAAADLGQEPESRVITVSPHGAQILIVRDPVTGEWINSETGNPFDLKAHERNLPGQVDQYREYQQRNQELEKKGETAMHGVYRQLRQEEIAREEAIKQQSKDDRLRVRFGTTDRTKAWSEFEKSQALEQHMVDVWTRAADNIQGAETTAGNVEWAADTFIDGAANATGPIGKAIRAGYKVSKGIGGTMAEDGISFRSAVSGAVKGGTDAVSDFVQSRKWKIAWTAGGEFTGQVIAKGSEGVGSGLVDGAVKAGLDALPDAFGKDYGADTALKNLKNGKVRVSFKSNQGRWIGKVLNKDSADKFIKKKLTDNLKYTAIKGTGTFVNKEIVKPFITDPLKKKF